MVTDEWIVLPGRDHLTLHIRRWSQVQNASHHQPPFLLVHGLASNARTWDLVAQRLAAAGHEVVAVDQRGHGLSDKPDGPYDFATVTADLDGLLDRLEWAAPIIVGQSWGGNVALAYGVRYPRRPHGLAFVDGGFIDLQMRPAGDWESIAQDLRPPSLAGVLADDLRARLGHFHPDWSKDGIDGTMGNFEVLDDGTIRPWLTLERHMAILRAIWAQRPGDLYPHVLVPVYIAVAEDGRNADRLALQRQQVAAAVKGLPRVRVERFPATDHDIHIHRPAALAASLLHEATAGLWSAQNIEQSTKE
jgi:pimeloyl-ACP methyl ester carboxylesterase